MNLITSIKHRRVASKLLVALTGTLIATAALAVTFKITSVPIGSEAPAQVCDADCVIMVNVILLNDDPNFKCQTFLEYETYKPTRGTKKKVVWQINETLQAGDKAKYFFDDTEGVKRLPKSTSETDDFEDRALESTDKKRFHWKLKDVTTKTPTHFEFHIIQKTNGVKTGDCKPQDPVILNNG